MSQKQQKSLRFAALIRVSSEKQERQGESLRTQAKQIKDAVAQLGGIITKRYAGQEHATPGWERQQMEALLADAAKERKPFDAVIVADPSRWSRDNERNKVDLRTLRDNGIRFFTLTTEHDLHDANARLFLGMAAEINEYQAALSLQKCISNRVNRAKRGVPTSGQLPFGRTYNRQTGKWGIDPEKQALVKDAARRYIAGESLEDLAKECDMHATGLLRTLTKRCGPKWTESFNVPRLKINETITHNVPSLLPDETIQAILERAKANKTYSHGHIKNRFLLSRMVFCGHCGGALSGSGHVGRLYYMHLWDKKKCLKGVVRADELEATVMQELFECFGNPVAVQRAIEQATPDAEKEAEDRKRIARIARELEKVKSGRERILTLVVKGAITEAQSEKQLRELKDREARLQDEWDRLSEHVAHIPSRDAIKRASQQVASAFRERVSAGPRAAIRQANTDLESMSWEEKRALVEAVFSGRTPDGRRMGVYIERVDGQTKYRRKRWKYTIRGHLIDEQGMTMSLERLAAVKGEQEGTAPQQRELRELQTKKRQWYRCLR